MPVQNKFEAGLTPAQIEVNEILHKLATQPDVVVPDKKYQRNYTPPSATENQQVVQQPVVASGNTV